VIKLLPFILIPVLILGGLWYFRFSAGKSNPVTSLINQEKEEEAPVEVPKTVPGASTEDRVQSLEDTLTKLVPQVNSLKSGSSQSSSSNNDSKIAEMEAVITDLKVRVAALEKATPAPVAASGSKYPLYIPLGAGGGPWQDQEWHTLTEYQASINPDNYSGYSSMQLEVNFRLIESAGTGYVRLYNVTDSSSISSQVETTSTSFGLKTSGTFKLPSGQKTYSIQVKSSSGKDLYVQSARVKVNF
jgi:hypothetical protein